MTLQNKIDNMKEAFDNLVNATDNKETIDTLGSLKQSLADIEVDTTALEKENKELLMDYKEMIKHTSWHSDENPDAHRGAPEPIDFDSFLADALTKINNN